MLAKKQWMSAFGFVLILLMIVAVACTPTDTTSQSAAQPAVANSGITVVGQGEAFGQPDQAEVQVGVETFAESVAQATEQNEAAIQAVMAALTAQGIAEEDIQTTNYSLWAEQIYGERGPEGIAGYRVANQVNVTIHDINKVGDVLAAVTEAGANSIYGIHFRVADPAALEAQARAEAIANARERAETLASLSDVELGQVIAISEIIGQPSPFPLGRGGAESDVASVPTLSPGQLSHQVQVQVTFAIQ
jgi:uncharacterized protein YggE